ncbi:PREDICTED: catenin alpha-3-like, partial [Apaloderma vittatum]|uniref:catenin alpha-3-like n=1 Tax=Apaloderma vittatum TaxID=57397 RepID=UPI0005218C0C
VANLACSLSTNEDGTKIVQTAANHIETLCPQVINAALALAARPKSQVVKNNMEMYRSTWENHIHVLTEAVDDITSIDDFLAVSESHILEDVNKCIIALREQNADDLDRAAGAIRGRASRVAHIVSGEMDNYEPGAYSEGVMTHVQYLTKTVIPEFISQVHIALESLSKNTVHLFDDNQFVDISKKVYDTIHNIRCSVMMIRLCQLRTRRLMMSVGHLISFLDIGSYYGSQGYILGTGLMVKICPPPRLPKQQQLTWTSQATGYDSLEVKYIKAVPGTPSLDSNHIHACRY